MITESTFPAVFVGDQPAQRAVFTVDDLLSEYPNQEVVIRKPDGTAQTFTGIATVDDDEIHVALNGVAFTVPGEWSLQLVLSGPGVKQSLYPVPFIVEQEDGWLTMGSIRSEWRDAPDDVPLYRILQVAKLQVCEYGPSLGFTANGNPAWVWDDPELPTVPAGWIEDPDHPGFFLPPQDEPQPRPPANFVQAQRMQARNIWNAAKTDPSGAIGDNGFEIRPYPMDNFIKQIIRPKRAIPYFGRA